MVKSNELFSKNYKDSEKIEESMKNNFVDGGFNVIKFDIGSEFEKCNKGCPIFVDHMGEKMPYARWVLYNQCSRPDLIINFNKPILIEIKYKNKKFLWVNTRDYKDYILWAKILQIPLYILMFVKAEESYYIHPLELETDKLKTLVTRHDKNEVFDVTNQSIKFSSIEEVINFLKK